jgi:hypothetical protein
MALTGRLLATAVLALGLMACSDVNGSLTAGIEVENRTSLALHFTLVRPDGQTMTLGGADLAPGAKRVLISGSMLDPDAGWLKDRCIAGPLVAYGPDGTEIARRDPPMCATSNSLWIVDGLIPVGTGFPTGLLHVTFAHAD